MIEERTGLATEPALGIADYLRTATALEAEVGRVIVGQAGLIRGVLIALIGGGHVLVEGVPGLGKTLLVRTLAQVLDLRFNRIQFTPDLMPADILGTTVLAPDEAGGRRFSFQPGPIFANLVLADEINRATPKTQSALLEAMQEQTVTAGMPGAETGPEPGGSERAGDSDGYPRRQLSRPLPNPFFVLATQNPIELEGTYPLPEAQLDRFFFKLRAISPTVDELETILDRTTVPETVVPRQIATGEILLRMHRLALEVPVAAAVRRYVARLVVASDPTGAEAPPLVRRYVRLGASPRAAQALLIAGKIQALLNERLNVAFDDIRRIAPAALRHRLILNLEAQVAGIDADAIVAELVQTIPVDAV